MTENIKTTKDQGSSELISFFIRWKKQLLIVGITAIVLSVILSSPLFITPKFKSTVVMFPAASNAISKALLSENPSSKADVLEFGEEEQAEQLLQVLYSNEIRTRIIKKYNLMKHYDIDPNSKYKMTRLFEEYKSNIRFKRNEFMAVEIDVLDTDPQIAANIANDIAALVDTVKNKIQKERAIIGYKIVENEYKSLQKEIAVMEDSLDVMRKMGINDYETQSEMIHQQLAIELAKNNTRGIKALQTELDILSKYGGTYVSLRDALGFARSRLSLIKSKSEEARTDAQEVLPQKFVVDYAFKAEKKVYPVRWLIVVVSTFSALLLTVITIIILENLQTPNTKH